MVQPCPTATVVNPPGRASGSEAGALLRALRPAGLVGEVRLLLGPVLQLLAALLDAAGGLLLRAAGPRQLGHPTLEPTDRRAGEDLLLGGDPLRTARADEA